MGKMREAPSDSSQQTQSKTAFEQFKQDFKETKKQFVDFVDGYFSELKSKASGEISLNHKMLRDFLESLDAETAYSINSRISFYGKGKLSKKTRFLLIFAFSYAFYLRYSSNFKNKIKTNLSAIASIRIFPSKKTKGEFNSSVNSIFISLSNNSEDSLFSKKDAAFFNIVLHEALHSIGRFDAKKPYGECPAVLGERFGIPLTEDSSFIYIERVEQYEEVVFMEKLLDYKAEQYLSLIRNPSYESGFPYFNSFDREKRFSRVADLYPENYKKLKFISEEARRKYYEIYNKIKSSSSIDELLENVKYAASIIGRSKKLGIVIKRKPISNRLLEDRVKPLVNVINFYENMKKFMLKEKLIDKTTAIKMDEVFLKHLKNAILSYKWPASSLQSSADEIAELIKNSSPQT